MKLASLLFVVWRMRVAPGTRWRFSSLLLASVIFTTFFTLVFVPAFVRTSRFIETWRFASNPGPARRMAPKNIDNVIAPNAITAVNLKAVPVWRSNDLDTTRSIAWGDMDGDGDLDLAAGNFVGPNKVYLNEGGMLQVDAAWTSADSDSTQSIAWGDVDGDGDLDLAAGVDWVGDTMGGPEKLYLNEGGMLQTIPAWTSADSDITYSVAWGDVDGDGDLDLAAGNGGPNKLYLNDSGMLQMTPAWVSADNDNTRSVAWGDMDGDGDLDLAAGIDGVADTIGGPEKVYLNEGGLLQTTAAWTAADSDYTSRVAWGDMDGDGDLDLAVGNKEASSDTPGPEKVYLNEGGTLQTTPTWTSDDSDDTYSVAWGDVDSDGDLDLAVGNTGTPNKIYMNEGGMLQTAAAWTSADFDFTEGVAWGDMDSDGDLDLAATGRAKKVYQNEGGTLQTAAAWIEDASAATSSLAWGDMDGDGDLDLAVGNSVAASDEPTPNKVYLNAGGTLQPNAAWTSDDNDDTEGVAWGDIDNDGDLDLAAGNSGTPNKVYLNTGGMLQTTAAWVSIDSDLTTSVAWGDVDGDGDLDLAAGAIGSVNKLYLNQGGMLQMSAAWVADHDLANDVTFSVAWGDVDGDGDLDLAAGNSGSNKLYLNEGGMLQTAAAWTSADAFDQNLSVAWGDVDGDGDLDLAAGGFGVSNKLYLNEGGMLQTAAAWTSADADFTSSVAWGDVDSDGDLDLAAGNRVGPNRVYLNQGGMLQATAAWLSAEVAETQDVAWGDVDNDGDLDLAVVTVNSPLGSVGLYYNRRRTDVPLLDNPPHVKIPRPGVTDDASFFSTPHIIQVSQVTITYTLFDSEGNSIPKISPEFSPTGGGQWFPATPGVGGDGLTNLAASPQGTAHTFLWHAEQDLIRSDNVVFRIRAQPGYTHSPILWPAVDGQSLPFRVAAPTYIKVADEGGNVVADANVFVDGQHAGLTNRAGLLNPSSLSPGATLVALARQAEQPTVRGAHDGWAYRTYLTSLAWTEEGQAQPFPAAAPGEQRLVIRHDHPLVFFNLLVSIEWDADEAYLAQWESAVHKASDYLYDFTDGQMVFGQVAIYDNGEHWADADIQVATKNVVRPHAYIGGIIADDPSHVISLGRGWDGRSSNQGRWDQPAGYRTVAHEFGHYALHLYDEYFYYLFDEQNNLTGEARAYCTGPHLSPATDATNASVMYYQYASSELSARGASGLWSDLCEQTAQWQLNTGESAWETLVRKYGDSADPPRWRFITPGDRTSVLAGPEGLPVGLAAWPLVTVQNAGSSTPARPLTVYNTRGQPQEGAIVALYKTAGQVIGQGFTDGNGHLDLYGVSLGDTVRAASFDGGLAGSVPVGEEASLRLTLAPLVGLATRSQQGGAPPHLQVRAEPGPDPAQVELFISLQNFGPGADPSLVIHEPGSGVGHVPILSYSPSTGLYQSTIRFSATQRGLGDIRAVGEINNSLVRLHTTYRLQQVANDGQHQDVYADDGNLNLHLAPGSLPGNETYFVVMPPGATPGPLPIGLGVVGFPYAVTASGALAALAKPAILTLRYDPLLLNLGAAPAELGIYRWEPNNQSWQALPSTLDEEHTAVSATVTALGTYALLALAESLRPLRASIYLPIISTMTENQ